MSTLKRFTLGTKAIYLNRPCEIVRVIGVAEVLVLLKDTGETKSVLVSDLKDPASEARPARAPHPDSLSPKKMAVAEKRYEIIRPLLTGPVSKAQVAERAKECGTSTRSIYRWISDYRAVEAQSALAPKHEKTRKKRLSDEIEEIIRIAIEEHYLESQRLSQGKVVAAVQRKCRLAGLKPPNHKTIRRRIKDVPSKKAVRARRGKSAERDRFEPTPSEFPGASYPLAVVQIDHHYLDIELVDDVTRNPIGRAWLTLAIDVYSRMVVGYYLSLEAPSANSVGLCMQNAILPKDHELADLGISNRWDVWGRMATLHADNGTDFRCKSVTDSCVEHGISIEWRPVGKPNWGGRIERLFGTIAKEFHALPGTTFSNIRDREGYDSAAKSALTLKEAQKWLLLWITGVYHERVHSQLGMSPRAMWERGILGDGKKQRGIGIPPKHQDPERLRLDFLPCEERTVQRSGITIDHVNYYSDEIRVWIGEKLGGLTPKFKVRRDPFDISKVFFLDPTRGDYIEVPYADIRLPSITIWELKAGIRELKRRGATEVNEALIFRTLEEMEALADKAKSDTRKARRSKQRKSMAEQHRDKNSKRERPPVEPKNRPAPAPKDLHVVVDNDAPTPADEDAGEEFYEFTDEELDSGWHKLN
ncbi:Mu transposase C-terminal domain-containing protein [Pacificispira sp.]|uniref:Mu transposase C-terminal domain-containing protein n=1 Tax=Pacificispira sp. TaxID=2888761 RepID=UPI003BAA6A90